MLILELIDYVAELSLSLDMPEKSKNSKSPAKETVKEKEKHEMPPDESEKGEKEKPKKFSQKDHELLVENLEGIPAEQFWNTEQLRRVRNDEEVSVEIGVAIHPDFHQSDSETGQDTDTESVLDEGALDRILVVSPPGKHPKKVNGKMIPPANYLKKNVSVVTMKKKAVFNAVRASASKAPKYRCEVPGCDFSCNLKKEFTAHMKGCHDGVHVDVSKEGRNRTRVCIAEVAGAVKPKFLIDKNNKLKGWVEANATLIKMNVDKERTPIGRMPVVQTASRKSASQPTQTQSQTPSIGTFNSQDWQAPVGNRNGTPIPPGVLGSSNLTPKRKVTTRYTEADDSIMVGKEAKKDKMDEKEKSPEAQSDNLSDLSSLTTNRTPNSSISLLENVQTSTLRPGDAKRLLDYSEDDLDETIIRRSQTQSQSQDTRAVIASDIDMIEKDRMTEKIRKLEENVAVVQSRNDALEEENIGLLYYKMKAKDWIEDRDKMIALLKSKEPVPEELSSQVISQGEEMKCEEVGTQSDINMTEMRRLAWMDRDEEERVKEVGVLRKRLERSEVMNTKYMDKVKDLREENMRLEKNRDDLKKRCDQDGDVILSLTVSIRSLEMVNKEQAHKLKDLDRKIPCRKVDCKGPKECNRSHEFKMGVFMPAKKTLCTYFLKNECNRGSKCKWSHEIAKHPLEKVRDQIINIQGNDQEEVGSGHNNTPEEMDQDSTDNVEEAEKEVETDVVVSLEEQLEPVSQQPLPPNTEEDQSEKEPRGVNNVGTKPKVLSRGRGVRSRRPSSSEVAKVQFGRGRGFDHGKALKAQEYYVNNVKNVKNRGRSRERGVSPSPRKGQRSRGSSSASFVSAKSSLSSRNSSLNRSQERRPASQPRRIAPPRPRTPERPRSVGEVRSRGRLPPRRPPSDNEIGKWYRQEMEREEQKERRRRNRSIPSRVASREDLRVMSDDGVRYVQERLVSLSQSGNGFGQRFPRSSGPNTFRGNNEELRDRAVDRMSVRTSNRIHSGEIYNMAAGTMRERMERSLYGRR